MMPSYRELVCSATETELPEINPVVLVTGSVYAPNQANCLHATRRMDILPGRALFRFDVSAEQASPITLNAALDEVGYSKYPYPGSRVKLQIDGKDIWRGWITDRVDSADQDSVLFEGVEDQWLLSKVFVRGALVYDPEDAKVKYVESFSAVTNPNGLWNCIFAPFEGGVSPVFAPTAKRIMNYSNAENTDVAPPGWDNTVGEYVAWTPKRFLWYLCNLLKISQYGTPTIDGRRRSISYLNPAVFKWEQYEVDSLVGVDPSKQAEGNAAEDPLDRKSPEQNYQGMSIASALDTTLRIVGTHQVFTKWTDNNGPTLLGFAPIRWTAIKSGVSPNILYCQRSGPISGAFNRVTSFSVAESIHDYAETVVVDGATVKIETSLNCDVSASTGIVNLNTSLLVPAWTEAEEIAWKQCVSGVMKATSKDNAKYARFPLDVDNRVITVWENLIIADGEFEYGVRKPSVNARDQPAMVLASQFFPKVFRAFKINTELLESTGVLNGFDDRYIDRSKFAVLQYNRGVLPNQLQYLLQTLGKSGAKQENWLTGSLPVRISVKVAEGGWHDLAYNSQGIQVSGDGLIWIDLINGSQNWDSLISTNPGKAGTKKDGAQVWTWWLRSFKINAAVPTEWRVRGESTNKNNIAGGGTAGRVWGVADTLQEAFGGEIKAYFDSLGSFKEHHQVNSSPSAAPQYTGNDSYPLKRILPDGNESASATYAAERKLRYLNAPKRNSNWTLPGIAVQWNPGDFVGDIQFLPAGVEVAYPVNSPVGEVKFDFVNQKTELGGLISEATR